MRLSAPFECLASTAVRHLVSRRPAPWRAVTVACLVTCVGLAIGTAAWAAPPGGKAAPGLPAVNLTVEMRIVDEAAASGHGDFTVSTVRPAEVAPPPLLLKVLNGRSATLRLDRAQPVQWVQAAARGAVGTASAGAGAGNTGSTGAAAASGGVVNAVQWMPSGQALDVQPSWPGGVQDVTLAVRATDASLHSAPDAALPARRRQEAGTTLVLPLGTWATFAATGTAVAQPRAGDVSTLSLAARGRQLMQVRVSLPAQGSPSQ